MPHNFWYDVFTEPKEPAVQLPPLTKSERIANLTASISRFQMRLAEATDAAEVTRIRESLAIRKANLQALLSKAA